ncbi:GNAT family N-acetyltransferase [Actinopolymorpha alba]|uniref:GNAT family N-acetyltransferase n=1 Tax=Actinopolymorpha alba TaxID=533267 RepID=UPI000A05AE02
MAHRTMEPIPPTPPTPSQTLPLPPTKPRSRSTAVVLGGIQIHPAFQGNGIGTHLITALIQESRSTAKPLHLDVDRNNVRARRLYERLGFEQHAESERDFHMTFHPDRVVRQEQAGEDLNR